MKASDKYMIGSMILTLIVVFVPFLVPIESLVIMWLGMFVAAILFIFSAYLDRREKIIRQQSIENAPDWQI